MENKRAEKKSMILRGVYNTSWRLSMTTLMVIAILEVFMLVYTFVNPALYGQYIGRYRAFYITLLSVAIFYFALNLYVKRDVEHRYRWLNIANPLCAAFFFAWSLLVTWSDATVTGVVDATVFMTFSLMIPLSFYLFPAVYATIAIVADVIMLYLTVTVSGTVGSIINVGIFFVFQLVLGINFLLVKKSLAERIIEEQINAGLDVLSDFPNRRVYTEDLTRLTREGIPKDLAYITIDINGLKEVNDRFGHEAGDRLIFDSARCIEHCFSGKGRMYRIGGDEFVVLIQAQPETLDALLADYEDSMRSWPTGNNTVLSASYGCASHAEYPDSDIIELARVADRRMYEAKARYYQTSGADRRKYVLESNSTRDGAIKAQGSAKR